MGDHAAPNDTAVFALLQALHPTLNKRQRPAFRIRCLGHIVNLCAHALIFGKGKGNSREDTREQSTKQMKMAGHLFGDR